MCLPLHVFGSGLRRTPGMDLTPARALALARSLSLSAPPPLRTSTTQQPPHEYEIKPPTNVTDRTCGATSPKCNAAQIETAKPTATSDRKCKTVRECVAGKEWESKKLTATTNRECKPVTVCDTKKQYIAASWTKTADRVCRTATVCTSKQFQVSALAATKDRVCKGINTEVCKSGQKEIKATATTDRSCQSTASQKLFDKVGTSKWTPPKGVTSVSVVCVGGGGAGTYNGGGNSGAAGGGLGWRNNIPVSSDKSYTITVGRSGIPWKGSGVDHGGDSSFVGVSGKEVSGRGGQTASNRGAAQGGRFVGDGGGIGGSCDKGKNTGGGGGAGGYTGAGGHCGSLGRGLGDNGQGGGGGGGFGGSCGGHSGCEHYASGGGGGVGLQGKGTLHYLAAPACVPARRPCSRPVLCHPSLYTQHPRQRPLMHHMAAGGWRGHYTQTAWVYM